MIDINKAIESLNWNKEPRGLYEPIEYALAAGGKRIRPTLALIAADTIVNGGLINGDAIEQTLPAALAPAARRCDGQSAHPSRSTYRTCQME